MLTTFHSETRKVSGSKVFRYEIVNLYYIYIKHSGLTRINIFALYVSYNNKLAVLAFIH